MDPWNIIICTDIQDPFVVFVPVEPSKWTLANLKQETWKKCISVSEDSLSFYCNEQLVPQGKPLTECPVNVYCPHNNSTLHINIPQREKNKWSVNTLRTAICFKLGTKVDEAKSDILAMSGSPLTKISALTNNCLLTYTRIKHLQVSSPVAARLLVNVPLNTTNQFTSRRNIYDRETRPTQLKPGPNDDCLALLIPIANWESISLWTITIQQLNGSKNDIQLQNPSQMPIFKLREAIKDALSVDTYQQMLTIRDVVLEDWDETGAAMMITHYPLFHDGVTVYLVQLVDGIQVNVHVHPTNNRRSLTWDSLYMPKPGCLQISRHPAGSNVLALTILPPTYINIHVPSKVQLKTLGNIMITLSCWSSINPIKIYLLTSGQSISPSDKPVSSVEWISNNVTLSLTQPTISNITNYTTNSHTFLGQSHSGFRPSGFMPVNNMN